MKFLKCVTTTIISIFYHLLILQGSVSMSKQLATTESYLEIGPRIISGKPTTITKHRHLALLTVQQDVIVDGKLKTTFNMGHGALLTLKWVVTAAHVLFSCTPDEIMVFAGMSSVSELEEGASNVQAQGVCARVLHPEYDHSARNNHPKDIAVVKLRGAFRQTSTVIALGYNSIPYYYEESLIFGQYPKGCIVAGLGNVDDPRVKANQLQETVLLLIPSPICIAEGHIEPPKQSVLCAHNKHASVYKGDSGSPLMCQGCFVGVVSGGDYNASTPKSKRVGIFVRVDYWKGWVIDTIASIDRLIG